MGGTTSRSQIVSQLNQTLAESITDIKQDCVTSTVIDQIQSVECEPPPGVTQSISANRSCLAINQAIAAYDTYLNLARASGRFTDQQIQDARLTWDLSNVDFADAEKRADFEARQQDLSLYVCNSCVFVNNRQSATFELSADCFSDGDVLAKLQNSVRAKVDQKLTTEKDTLAVLAEALQLGSDEQTQRTMLTNRVVSRITTEVMNSLIASTYLEQNMTIEDGSSSVYFNGNAQDAEISRLVSAAQTVKVFNDILTDTETGVIQNLRDKSNTIGDLLAEIDKTVNAISSSIRRNVYIVTILIMVLGIAFVAIFATLFVKKKQKQIEQEKPVTGDQPPVPIPAANV